MRKLLFLFFVLSTLNSFAQNLISGGKLKPEQAIMDIRHYTVALTVDPVQKNIKGYTDIDLILSTPATTLLFDLVHLYTVEKVWVNGKEQSFKHNNDLLYITPAAEIPAGKVLVKVQYGGTPGVAARCTGNNDIIISCAIDRLCCPNLWRGCPYSTICSCFMIRRRIKNIIPQQRPSQ